MTIEIIKDGNITSVPGFFAGSSHCGLKNSGKKLDICIINTPEGSVCSGVFTVNRFKAAPVILDIKTLKDQDRIKAIAINSGIANACTGSAGMENAKKMQQLTADALGISSREVLVSSTGVIGKQLPMNKIENGIKNCASAMDPDGGDDAARAILTTDLIEKKAAVRIITEDKKEITIGGIAKGSGMIEPNMATMLAFIGTDAQAARDVLDSILKKANEESFNSISVDGCQSTNDSAFLMANGKSGVKIERSSSDYDKLYRGVAAIMKQLAKKIVMDGEGATKFIEIKVDGAPVWKQAKKAAMKIANSNLFKTAIFGQDLNWGRINAALGASGIVFDPDKVNIYMNDKMIVKNGIGLDLKKSEADILLKPKDIIIKVDLNNGKENWTVWTSDLSFDYIKINALYHN